MPNKYSFGGIQLDVAPGRQRIYEPPTEETPFRVAILGDFSGRASREIFESGPKLANQKAMVVDSDNFEEVMARLGVALDMPVAGELRFRELDDFHPDNLYTNLSFFDGLRKAASAASAGRTTPRPASPPPARPAAPPKPADILRGNLLDRAMEETSSRTAGKRSAERDEFREMLDRLVAPHLQPREDADAASRRAMVAQAASIQMRALMHFPAFQELEAAWRSIFFLLRRVETDETLKLYLIDISKEELLADLAEAAEPRESGIGQLLVRTSEEVMGGQPWAVLAGNYTFGQAKEDVDALAKLGNLAGSLGAPWVAGGTAELLGCPSLLDSPDPRRWNQPIDPNWRDLRRSGVARWIGLALPRVLLRIPYGKKTVACERFAYEEMPDPVEHERYLWGNPAFACVALLAKSFQERGWKFRPGMHLNLEGLPVDVRERDGEMTAQPCAEVLMTERAAQAILEHGIMPLATLKGTDEVRLVRFQSIASPAAALSGRWASGSTYTPPEEEAAAATAVAPSVEETSEEFSEAAEFPAGEETSGAEDFPGTDESTPDGDLPQE
jgi:type VI secretion system protein ImpC